MPDTATVRVSCLAILARHQPENGQAVITPGETPADVAARLGIPRKDVNLVFINKKQAPWDHPLQDADHVAFIPLVSGG